MLRLPLNALKRLVKEGAMGQQPRVLDPAASLWHLFGARLRLLRQERGLSQRELGGMLFCSKDMVAKLEKAERHGDADLAGRCDRALNAQGSLLALWLDAAAQPDDEHDSHRYKKPASTHLDLLRRQLDTRLRPEDGPIRTVDEIALDVGMLVGWRLNSQYQQMSASLLSLLPEMHRCLSDAETDRRRIAALLFQAYRCGDALADKTGAFDLSARLIDLMTHMAEVAESSSLAATADYVRAEIFFASNDFAVGRRYLAEAASNVGLNSVLSWAQYGSIHMRASVLAARGGDRVGAAEHIMEAGAAAKHVPEGIYQGTAFGPASVRIHALSRALEVGDIEAALRAGKGWAPPDLVPAERRSHFHIDLGRARMANGDLDGAVGCFELARRIAPEHVHQHLELRLALTDVTARHARPPQALADLARVVLRPSAQQLEVVR